MSDSLRDLVDVMDQLRSPGGCPWDAEQTHASLIPYLLEETYETIEAIESGSPADLREELGDLLLQVVFHARIAAESEVFTIDDVAAEITAKLIRRHPHVFAGATVADAADSEAAWFQLKAQEKGRTSVTDGVPQALPALVLTAKLRHRAGKSGLCLEPASEDARAVVRSALAKLGDDPQALASILMAAVSEADDRGWDAETAARYGAREYREALIRAEQSGTNGAG